MHRDQDIVVVVDYHDQNLVIRRLDEPSGEERIVKHPTTRQDILLQFLIEALTLTMIGGLVGIAIGYGLGILVATLLPSVMLSGSIKLIRCSAIVISLCVTSCIATKA